MNEEENISKLFGTKNPFTTPEGYFDQLTESIMNRISDEPAADLSASASVTTAKQQSAHIVTLRRLRPWLAAACVCGVIAIGTLYLNHSSQQQEEALMANNNDADTYVDDAANYAMVDNQDIYVYLADM